MRHSSFRFVICALCIAIAPAFARSNATPAMKSVSWKTPVKIRTLKNGLKVVISEDHSAPTFGVCVTYGIGFRLEPQGRSGFAHLFEHMMFEGTPLAPKGTLDKVIEGGGGNNNGDTRYDFTEYIETAPVSALDPILWIEADRMKTLDFSPVNLENQRKVVEEEVRVNVLNQPYGLFFAIDLPGKAFDTYPNAHNFYGDFRDLDAARIEDVSTFYGQYYSPNNAVLAIVGDVDPAETFGKVEKYFQAIPARPAPPQVKLLEAPQRRSAGRSSRTNWLRFPPLRSGIECPHAEPATRWWARLPENCCTTDRPRASINSLLRTSRKRSLVDGGVNWPLGNPFEYNGPTLMTSFVVTPPHSSEEAVLGAYDAAIADLAEKGPAQAELDRIRAKMRSDWYGQLEVPISRASALSHAVLFDGNADQVSAVPDEIATVSAEEVRGFAAKYLVKTNRTIIWRVPSPEAAGAATGARQ